MMVYFFPHEEFDSIIRHTETQIYTYIIQNSGSAFVEIQIIAWMEFRVYR